MMGTAWRWALIACILLISCTGRAEVKMPNLFSDHMVLQRSSATPVWGWAGKGESVQVILAGIKAQTVAEKDGKWTVMLDLANCPDGPHEMAVEARNKTIIHDVVIGEVWLASGQSNMAAMLKNSGDAKQEIMRSTDSLLREFHVDGSSRDGSKGKWTVCTPPTTGDFSAIAYYFAKFLRGSVGRPVGIINAARSGTEIEAWMSEEALSEDSEISTGHNALVKARADYPEKIAAYQHELAEWMQTHDRKDPGCANPSSFAAPGVPMDGWVPITLPGGIAGTGLPRFGALWVKKDIEIPLSLVNETVKMQLGVMEGFDTVYWNGEKIADTPAQNFPGTGYHHYYVVPPALVHPGKAVIAIRVFSPSATPAFLSLASTFWVGPINLAGEWFAKSEFALPPLSAVAEKSLPKPPENFSGAVGAELFDSIIAPIKPYRLAGILWYQGESNAGRAYQYRKAFPLLIKDWRRQWGRDDLPFYFCQLANYLPKRPDPGESEWAELREAQSLALSLPSSGQAVLIDLGEAGDIHPRNKKTVGERLSRLALANNYGKNVVWSGPVYDSIKIEGKTLRVKFLHADGGLVAHPVPARYDVRTLVGETAPLIRNNPDSELEGFAICGADHKWVWADAKIDGDSVVVWSDKISSPIAIRYGWSDNPTCNLFNGAGLPAAPFRTDDFPAITRNAAFGKK
ncbi:MAG: acetyl esterase [Verrucomicrobiaceae bacterium]|nr:MAG: acetyl esterase [Verrucomicrobiaceae bacterium]